jgi:Ca2+-binding EF-hand superfamily protein
VKKCVILASATLALASAALAQTKPAAAPKPIARADYIKTVDTRFGAMDANHDGGVTKAELAAEQQHELQQTKARIEQQLRLRFSQLDTNKDGQLTIQEFLAIAPPLHTAENPDQMLQRLDTNHDGKISADEFRAPELAKFSRIDANHDGVVTPDEIKAAAAKK